VGGVKYAYVRYPFWVIERAPGSFSIETNSPGYPDEPVRPWGFATSLEHAKRLIDSAKKERRR
jgi:hypothetical protein